MKIAIVGKLIKLEPENEAEMFQLEHLAEVAREETLCSSVRRYRDISERTFTVEKKTQ